MIYTLVIALTFFSGFLLSQDNLREGIHPGNRFPDFVMPSPSGKNVSSEILKKGKKSILIFWASWCAPCRQELKKLSAHLQRQMPDTSKIQLIFISLDYNMKAWTKAIAEFFLDPYIHVSELRGWEGKYVREWVINAIPSNFILNDRGIILKKNLSLSQLIQQLQTNNES